jgi:hypothetical protein
VFKVSDVMDNHQQAYELLTQSILSGDDELIALTIELNKSLKIAPNLLNELVAYIDLMRSEGKSDLIINQSQTTLCALTKHLYNLEISKTTYRQAADLLLSEANPIDIPFSVNLIRSFYPYWKNAYSVSLEANHTISAKNNHERQAIIDLWNNLDGTFLTTLEESLIKNYTKAIKAINVPDEEIGLRTNLAKLLLIKLRAFEKSSKGYRANIDGIKNSLSNDDLFSYFLSVTREFYAIWVDAQLTHNQ